MKSILIWKFGISHQYVTNDPLFTTVSTSASMYEVHDNNQTEIKGINHLSGASILVWSQRIIYVKVVEPEVISW